MVLRAAARRLSTAAAQVAHDPKTNPAAQARPSNAPIAIGLFGFVGSVYYYTMYQMRVGAQADLADLDGVDGGASAEAALYEAGSGAGVSVARGTVAGARGGAGKMGEMAARAKAAAMADAAEKRIAEEEAARAAKAGGWLGGWFGK
jgi:hypothetical protein